MSYEIRNSKEQIENQNLSELEQSLERVNDALKHPESFGILRLKVVADIGLVIAKSGAEAHYEVGILPILLERKKLILERIRNIKGEQRIDNLKDLINSVSDESFRKKLEKEINELKEESSKLIKQTKEVEQARIKEELNAQEKMRRLEQELSERKAKIRQSYFQREFVATIVGSILLLILAGTQIIAMFYKVQTTEIINNAFLIILGSHLTQ